MLYLLQIKECSAAIEEILKKNAYINEMKNEELVARMNVKDLSLNGGCIAW